MITGGVVAPVAGRVVAGGVVTPVAGRGVTPVAAAVADCVVSFLTVAVCGVLRWAA
ncbi:MAG TPA: hypothetical protein VGD12_04645 [Blastococcus sp.]